MGKKKEKKFEEMLARLEEISGKLEDGSLQLDESIRLYEEGMELAKACYHVLKTAELKITEIKKKFEEEINKDS
ncbi:MAG: exodeoxyribonuclease VII small subunit [Melioribacter sp.]|uniref:exodeoxyribonuclease VII small subunit n=2 Tax=Melioribacter TaxID=1134403 RepID=UPI003BCF25B6